MYLGGVSLDDRKGRKLVMGLYMGREERTFETTLNSGLSGEQLLKQDLMSRGFQIIDRADNLEYRKRDIDFETRRYGEKYYSVEVKTDSRMHETGNIVIEMNMFRDSGTTNGWYHYCDADFLCFIDEVTWEYYMINWKKLKKLMEDREEKGIGWRKCKFWNGADNCYGLLTIIPKRDLVELNLISGKNRILSKTHNT